MSQPSRATIQLRGVAGLAAVALIIGLLVAMYQKKFIDVVDVQVRADRSGLLLDPGADVRAFGVKVGEVRDTRLEGDDVIIDVAIIKDLASTVPRNVEASINSTTVFGAKFIDLKVPIGNVEQPIVAGEVINAGTTTVEVNDVFQRTLSLLTAVDPGELNSALTGVATALDGNGENLGRLIASGDNYLKQLNPALPTLGEDFARSREVIGNYSDVLPSLLNTAQNLSVTSETFTRERAKFHTMLESASRAANGAESFLAVTEPALTAMLKSVVPFSGLLYLYGPQLPCTVDLLVQHAKVVDMFYSNKLNGIQGYTGFLPGQEPYTNAKNAPKLVSGVGPRCYPLATKDRFYVSHVKFDDGTEDVYDKVKNTPGEAPGLLGAILGTTGLDKVLGKKPASKGPNR